MGGYTTIEEILESIEQGKCEFPMSINGKRVYTAEEAKEAFRKLKERGDALVRGMRQEWLATPAGQLCQEFYRKFQEYRAYIEANPRARPSRSFAAVDFHEDDLFEQGLCLMEQHEQDRAEKDLQNLRRAHNAARCQHHHADGRRCGSPRERGKKLCHWHQRMEEARALKLDLGPMEDPDSIQMAIMKLQRAVIDGTLDSKTTGQLAYTIQLAAWNVTRTSMARETKE